MSWRQVRVCRLWVAAVRWPGMPPRSRLACACPNANRYGTGGDTNQSCTGQCDAGYSCPSGSTSARQRECGSLPFFCPPGSAAPTTVAAGWYTTPVTASPSHRTGHALCEPGFTCSGDGSRVACGPGTWAADAGLSDPQCQGPCAAGRFGATPGQTSPQCDGPCSPGYWCDEGSTSPVANECPSGRWGGYGSWNSSCTGECEAGYACPSRSTSPRQRECGSAAFYCPTGSSSPVPAGKGWVWRVVEPTHRRRSLTWAWAQSQVLHHA